MKKNHLLFLLFFVFATFTSCSSFAPSNIQILITEDCGKTWKIIKTGSSVPTGIGNYCYRVVMIPNYQLVGDSRYKVTFNNNVSAFVDMDYTYSIVEPLKFIPNGRGIGSAKFNTEASKEYIDSQFESLESTLLDKKIKDICRDFFKKQDVVDFDDNFEKIIFDNANADFEKLGIRLESLDVIPTFNEQTTEAIDATTALRIYKSKGLEKEGLEIIKAKASSSKIIIHEPKKAKD
jgi:hypothetical protein